MEKWSFNCALCQWKIWRKSYEQGEHELVEHIRQCHGEDNVPVSRTNEHGKKEKLP